MNPEIRNLVGGILLQNGSHVTAGSLMTFRWSDWREDLSEANVHVFGSFRSPQSAGIWTETTDGIHAAIWACLMCAGRMASYQYKFRFHSGGKAADIKIRLNPCICFPCIPAWFTVPDWVTEQKMIEHEDSIKGDHWIRLSSRFGSDFTFYYNLLAVVDPDGRPTRKNDFIEMIAPSQVFMTF